MKTPKPVIEQLNKALNKVLADKEVMKRKKLEQNIWLQPGDQVIVP